MRALLAAVLTLAVAGCANAATLSLPFSVVSPPPASASIACPVQYPAGGTAFTAPVAAGTVICPVTVSPSNWSGTLSLSGPSAGLVTLNNGTASGSTVTSGSTGSSVVVGASPITAAGTDNITITATP